MSLETDFARGSLLRQLITGLVRLRVAQALLRLNLNLTHVWGTSAKRHHHVPGLNQGTNVKNSRTAVGTELLDVARPDRSTNSTPMRDLHKVLKQTRAAARKGRPSDDGFHYLWAQDGVRMRVSPKSLNRALQICSDIFREAERRSFLCVPGTDDTDSATIIATGVKISLRLKETTVETRHTPTELEIRNNRQYPSIYPLRRTKRVPSGRFELILDAPHEYMRTIRETVKSPFEQRIGVAVDYIAHIASRSARETCRYAEQRRLWAEEEARRKLEEESRVHEMARVARLFDTAMAWQKAKAADTFLDEVESLLIAGSISNIDGFAAAEWLTWARGEVMKNNPLAVVKRTADVGPVQHSGAVGDTPEFDRPSAPSEILVTIASR